jgi:hypothetical protein
MKSSNTGREFVANKEKFTSYKSSIVIVAPCSRKLRADKEQYIEHTAGKRCQYAHFI